MKKEKGYFFGRKFFAGCMTAVFALLIALTIMIQGADEVCAASFTAEETTYAEPKVSTKTTKKSSKKKVKMKTAAKKSCTKRLPATKKKSANTKTSDTAIVKTEKTVLTQITEKYTRKSRIKEVSTSVVTTIKTTTTRIEHPVDIHSDDSEDRDKPFAHMVSPAGAAPKMDKRVVNAFTKLGFTVKIDPAVSYEGHYDTKTRLITLREEDDTIYHELGHFLSFAAGNADESAEFKQIFIQEKSYCTDSNDAYTTQNSSEYFAEALKDYTLNPAALRNSRPMTCAAIEKALDKLTDSWIHKLAMVYGPVWK